ncbi:Uncharacterized protein DAT39_017163 [Clarias magur]|uniref:Uncharacterized protein n=1 Tax=Clarias magur TaxID=1594786 RepID=A0A8J4UBS6_CLAMG|nr:Uncharacterized protein DAT39_017163 [Clarias magur]
MSMVTLFHCSSTEIIMFCSERVHSKGNSSSSCAGTLKLIEQCAVEMSGHKKACKPFGQRCHLRINKATAIRGLRDLCGGSEHSPPFSHSQMYMETPSWAGQC